MQTIRDNQPAGFSEAQVLVEKEEDDIFKGAEDLGAYLGELQVNRFDAGKQAGGRASYG